MYKLRGELSQLVQPTIQCVFLFYFDQKKYFLKQRFQWDGTVQVFWAKGQKFLYSPGTKGQAQNLAMDRTGQPVKIQDGNPYLFSIISCFRTSFPVLEHLFLF